MLNDEFYLIALDERIPVISLVEKKRLKSEQYTKTNKRFSDTYRIIQESVNIVGEGEPYEVNQLDMIHMFF